MSKTLDVSRSASLIGLVGLALSAGSAALAGDKTPQNSPSTPLPGVTVVAPHRNAADPAALPMVRDFVKAHGAPSQIGQLARWTQNICPATVGLPPAFNAFVTRRVREVAAEVGAPVKAGERCQTNIQIIFTSEPQKVVDGLRDKAPVLLGAKFPAQAKRIATVSHPIQAWYALDVSGQSGSQSFGAGQTTGGSGGASEGMGSGMMSMGMGSAGRSGGTSMDFFGGGSPSGTMGTRLNEGRQSQFGAVIVVADANRASDYDVGPIADYVALLALSQTNSQDACGGLPSITDLLATTCEATVRSEKLTDEDLAYLKALYATNPSNALWVQQANITERMRDDIHSR